MWLDARGGRHRLAPDAREIANCTARWPNGSAIEGTGAEALAAARIAAYERPARLTAEVLEELLLEAFDGREESDEAAGPDGPAGGGAPPRAEEAGEMAS